MKPVAEGGAWLLALAMAIWGLLLWQHENQEFTERMLKQGYQQEIGGWQRGGAR